MSLASRLRHRVSIERRTNTLDSEGNLQVSWEVVEISSSSTSAVPLLSVPAEVLTGPGREVAGAGTISPETDARVCLRWFPGLTYEDRVVWDGRIFGITEITTDASGRREYRLRLKESKAQGQ